MRLCRQMPKASCVSAGSKTSRDTGGAEMTDWCDRPLDCVYPVVIIDAIHVKIRALAQIS